MFSLLGRGWASEADGKNLAKAKNGLVARDKLLKYLETAKGKFGKT